MIDGRRILAVVPARAGSKGVADKNMRPLLGLSLIGWAGRVARQVEGLDARVISTDAKRYAEEGRRHGLEAPFLRPAELSGDAATAADTVVHALLEMERCTGVTFDIVVIIEPSSPLRLPDDISRTIAHLTRKGRDSALTLSPLDPKWHPRKSLRLVDGRVTSLVEAGQPVTARQTLEQLYWRNGVCYAVSRECLVRDHLVIGPNCGAEVIAHRVVNIDFEWELEWAEFLLAREGEAFLHCVGLA